MTILINGNPAETISAQDRGLHYGDGVFETIAVKNGTLLCWELHFDRLHRGCQTLNIACPARELLYDETKNIINNSENEVLKIVLTRGAGGRGYKPPEDITPTRIIATYPWPDFPSKNKTDGIKVRICRLRMSHNPTLAGIKHLNRLEQILARQEWNDPDIAEGVLLDAQDNVIEGTMSNLFIITGNQLITPELGQCGIAGIVRQCILDCVIEIDMQTEVRTIKRDELFNSDEMFLCNSTIGIWPVQKLEDHAFAPGPWTRKISALLAEKEIIIA